MIGVESMGAAPDSFLPSLPVTRGAATGNLELLSKVLVGVVESGLGNLEVAFASGMGGGERVVCASTTVLSKIMTAYVRLIERIGSSCSEFLFWLELEGRDKPNKR
jgi:hypothetical protein